jgi:hypothetical protein
MDGCSRSVMDPGRRMVEPGDELRFVTGPLLRNLPM